MNIKRAELDQTYIYKLYTSFCQTCKQVASGNTTPFSAATLSPYQRTHKLCSLSILGVRKQVKRARSLGIMLRRGLIAVFDSNRQFASARVGAGMLVSVGNVANEYRVIRSVGQYMVAYWKFQPDITSLLLCRKYSDERILIVR